MNWFEILALLIVGHALADYAFQSEFMANGKSRAKPIPGVPWYQPMAAHCVLHGGMVGVVTQNVWLGLLEFAFHFAIDDTKCSGRISYNTDQALHIACKILWVAILFAAPAISGVNT